MVAVLSPVGRVDWRRRRLPNAYILGQAASAALIGGLCYGEGKMYTPKAGGAVGVLAGASVGFDAVADGDRAMVLVSDVPRANAIFNALISSSVDMDPIRRRP